MEDVVVPLYGEAVMPPNYYTPPYLTGKPEIEYHRLSPRWKRNSPFEIYFLQISYLLYIIIHQQLKIFEKVKSTCIIILICYSMKK